MAKKTASTTLELEIPGDVRYVPVVRKSVRFLAAALGFRGDRLDDIEIATAEAVTNAIVHGTPLGLRGRVCVRCRDGPGGLVVEVEDQGNGRIARVGEETEIESEHGRGMLMIDTLMDDAQVVTDECGTLLRMTKRM